MILAELQEGAQISVFPKVQPPQKDAQVPSQLRGDLELVGTGLSNPVWQDMERKRKAETPWEKGGNLSEYRTQAIRHSAKKGSMTQDLGNTAINRTYR